MGSSASNGTLITKITRVLSFRASKSVPILTTLKIYVRISSPTLISSATPTKTLSKSTPTLLPTLTPTLYNAIQLPSLIGTVPPT